MEWVGLSGCLMLSITYAIRAWHYFKTNRRGKARFAMATLVYLCLFSWLIVDYYSKQSILRAIANTIPVEIGIGLLIVFHISLLGHAVKHPPFEGRVGWSEMKRAFCRQVLFAIEGSLVVFYGYLGLLFRDASLYLASASGNTIEVQRSLMLGANPSCRYLAGITEVPVNACLESALDQGNLSIARLLIDHGAPLDEPDPTTHLTPLMYEVTRRDKNAVVFLIYQGVLIGFTTDSGQTALKLAASDTEIAHVLLQHGAFVNTTAPNRSTALFDFARAGNVPGMQDLIEHGAYVKTATQSGYTPLMAAANEGDPAAVIELISAGANIRLKDEFGHDALWYATSSHHTQAARVLESRLQIARV